jgi:peptidyl-prolyl cis-trans isomerase C
MLKKTSLLLASAIISYSSLARPEASAPNTFNQQPSTSGEPKVIPEVDLLLNGIVLDKDLFDYRVQLALQNGQSDTKELRQAIRDDLYNRTLLLEEAKRIGLTKNKTIKLMAQDAQENIYIDLVFQEYIKKHPITDEQLKAEYDRQVKLIGPKGLIIEYHLATIAVNSEEVATELILKAKKENFSKLAIENSVDPSASRNGDLGWININQMQVSLRAIIANIPKGHVTATPIQLGNLWHVFKVLDRREGKPAPFEQSKDRLKQAVIQNLKNDYIEELRQARSSNNKNSK